MWGGAAISHRGFAGVGARLSQYSYLSACCPTRSEVGYTDALDGQLPEPLPAEIYCHTLTDRSILSPERDAQGVHTLTLFGLHTPARLFDVDNDAAMSAALARAVNGPEAYLSEPLDDCLLRDAYGGPCIEAVTPWTSRPVSGCRAGTSSTAT